MELVANVRERVLVTYVLEKRDLRASLGRALLPDGCQAHGSALRLEPHIVAMELRQAGGCRADDGARGDVPEHGAAAGVSCYMGAT
jgi:hypothetical protein